MREGAKEREEERLPFYAISAVNGAVLSLAIEMRNRVGFIRIALDGVLISVSENFSTYGGHNFTESCGRLESVANTLSWYKAKAPLPTSRTFHP